MGKSKSDKEDAKDPLSDFTDDQKKLLLQSLEIVKQQVFSDVTKKMRNHLLVAASLVTLFGAISVVGLKTAVKDATVGALREDATLRQSIKDDAAAKVTKATELLAEIEGVLEKAKTEKVDFANGTLAELNSVLEEAKSQRREENLLFAKSAEELNALISVYAQQNRERDSK